jgi:hypothetical protein
MKSTPGYGFYHFTARSDAQEKASTDMGKTYGGMKSSGASKGAMGNMKTVKKVAAGKVNSK